MPLYSKTWQEKSAMELRAYDPQRDKEATHRVYMEVGWLEKGHEENADRVIEAGRAHVAEIDGSAEVVVTTAWGALHYLDEPLRLCAVTGVTTSRVARKQGLAARVTARAIAQDAADGALVAGLGMFEQGFYNRIGFGTGGYEHWVGFDPAQLRLRTAVRLPQRITVDDHDAAHAARLARMKGHGAVDIEPAALTWGEMMETKNGFGLGYRQGTDGPLTHYFWASAPNIERGPYTVHWTVYQDYGQFLELLAILRSLGDQVRLVRMREPQGIQVQDLIAQPFKHREVTAKSDFAQGTRAEAYWQMRICDLAGCLARTRLSGDTVRFNLDLSDPVEALLPEDAPWRGVAGHYVITLGPSSGAERGADPALPTLVATVNAFTRLWLGVRPATGLAVTDDLSGPTELLQTLDRALCLPQPKPDWDY
jgi:hypothetical protein